MYGHIGHLNSSKLFLMNFKYHVLHTLGKYCAELQCQDSALGYEQYRSAARQTSHHRPPRTLLVVLFLSCFLHFPLYCFLSGQGCVIGTLMTCFLSDSLSLTHCVCVLARACVCLEMVFLCIPGCNHTM